MTIDWFTLLAQLFNFALLLVLLRVFLYRPVLATMRRREELAMSALQGARELQAEAEAQRRELEAAREREERERQMTIDLGFAWLTLPSGTEVSVVDVPGHEDFLKNMLAGVGGIDVALLVVAADEAVMPQTREHLAIIDLLRIPRGVIALTKVDLVEDEEWLDLVTEEVRELARGTVLGGAAIILFGPRGS